MFRKHHASVVNGLVKLNWYVQQIVRLKNLCEEVGKRLNIKMFAAA